MGAVGFAWAPGCNHGAARWPSDRARRCGSVRVERRVLALWMPWLSPRSACGLGVPGGAGRRPPLSEVCVVYLARRRWLSQHLPRAGGALPAAARGSSRRISTGRRWWRAWRGSGALAL
eukprot:4980884-Alexandrium_andersonii.AAC.1